MAKKRVIPGVCGFDERVVRLKFHAKLCIVIKLRPSRTAIAQSESEDGGDEEGSSPLVLVKTFLRLVWFAD